MGWKLEAGSVRRKIIVLLSGKKLSEMFWRQGQIIVVEKVWCLENYYPLIEKKLVSSTLGA